MSALAAAASAYARRGWSVVPAHTVRDGVCSCGRLDCPAVAKHPRVRWEESMRVPASVQQVEAWWRRWPDANVAVATGLVSGVAVVDVDPRSGGDEALAALEQEHGPLPVTAEARSGGGGRHVWLALREGAPSAVLAPGVELKAERGIVLAPPSLHASGTCYAWLPGLGPEDIDPAPLPAWPAALARGASSPASRGRAREAPARTGREQKEFAAAWARAGVRIEPGDRTYLCPFHADHRPSLHVDSEACRWYCFGCRQGGGIGRLRRLLGEAPARTPRERLRGEVGDARPVTLTGGEPVPVVGEASHQDELLALAGGERPYGGVELEAVAELVPEPGDPVEGFLVAVVIAGRRVGRLRREDAAALRPVLEAAARGGGGATCRALVRGGWDRGAADVGRFGVVLFLPGPS